MMREVKDFKRKEVFEHFNRCDNPFIIMTTKIDVTNIVKYCKVNKNFYATLGFLVTKTVNSIEAFKYRYDENYNILYCDVVNSNYTDLMYEENIGFFDVPFKEDFKEYMDGYLSIKNKFLNDKYFKSESVLDVIWMSCFPWNTFNSLIPPFNKKVSIPQFIWDKYTLENDKYFINLMIMVNHGFADGLHIAKFIDLLNENIKNFNK